MTPDAKRALAQTIRALRERVLRDLHDDTERIYRLSQQLKSAGLHEAERERRQRLTAWIDEQVRAQRGAPRPRSKDDFRHEVEKQAAYTLLNRLIVLRLMEAPGPDGTPLRKPAVVTGGWQSPAYREFRELAQAIVQAQSDASEGYAFLLKLVFDDLALDLPGIFGAGGVADLVPVPASTLRHVVEELDKAELASCWTDDMTLGWVYQYWNDPEREALDAKINDGGKIEPHEIASKTQMFTERYMVDWLLQNSLGAMWLAMCRKHGWTPDVENSGLLDALELQRAQWRDKRANGEVALTDLMPLHSPQERRWAYYVPQPIPDEAVAKAPESVRNLKILDPAVGSGHFLVVALDLLWALYREEAVHRDKAKAPEWSDTAIVERILAENLHGIDLDPRAVQIAAAALWIKARQIAPEAHPAQLNLVASNLRLGSLAENDEGLAELKRQVERETGIPGELTHRLVRALAGADHLGSLLKIDRAVDEALKAHEDRLSRPVEQPDLFIPAKKQREPVSTDVARATLTGRLEAFLARHTGADDLGLRLRGEQLAAGVRFVRLLKEGSYDLVAANPPYQGTAKMVDAGYVEVHYPLGDADLYAAFLLRGLELVRSGGVSAMLTLRNWMFSHDYRKFRPHLFTGYDICAVGDFDRGAFEDVPDEVVSVVASALRKSRCAAPGIALCPTPRDDRSRDSERTQRKRAATLCHEGECQFDVNSLRTVPEWPLIYWWTSDYLGDYSDGPLLGAAFPAIKGLTTCNDTRFTRKAWEPLIRDTWVNGEFQATPPRGCVWVPFVNGAKGVSWVDQAKDLVRWENVGTEIAQAPINRYGRAQSWYFKQGIAFSQIGHTFTARIHRHPSILGNMGASVFPNDAANTLCMLNSSRARRILQSLNPGLHFEVSDVNRLPLFSIANADEIFSTVESAFAKHESHREPSVEFRAPGASPWRHAQAWAQAAVDRDQDEPLLEYVEELDSEPATDHLSFALGVALGRFGPNGEGILDPTKDNLSHALPAGILFVDTSLSYSDLSDSLGHPAAAPLLETWEEHGHSLQSGSPAWPPLREWLAHGFFKDVHKGMYENRPIHWPLSSPARTFVAFVNIHRFNANTLQVLIADHLNPRLKSLEGAINDLTAVRQGKDKKAARDADKTYAEMRKWRDDLEAFIKTVEQCADRGPLPTDDRCPPREKDARYAPDLDDGVMINSAALWPLLEPQWKEPKKWWKELSQAKGKKDYDWSHLAMRYWPGRVDEKCKTDPSLAVAHGCFWRYHPARAWAWELRLQDEITEGFRIEEAPYRPGGGDLADEGDSAHRLAYLRDKPEEALAAVEKEALRRMGRGSKRRIVRDMYIPEPGLWPRNPQAVWDMELRLAERQGVDFRVLTPDEAEARAAFEAANPNLVEERKLFLAGLVPVEDFLRQLDDGEAADSSDEEPEAADSEPDAEEEDAA
jgi:hypothetical protein